MDLHHSNGEDDISLSSSSCSFSTVYEDENERELLLSDTEEEEQNSRLPKRKMAVTRTSYRSKESSQRKKTREVYIQLKKQYLAARMYGGYEEMLILADLLYSLAHPPPSFDLGHSPSSSSHDTLPTSSSSLLPSCSYMICSSSSSLHTRMSKSPVLSSSSSCWRFKSLRKDRSLSPSSTSTSDLSEETQSSLSPSSPPPLSSSLSSFSPPARRHFLSSSSCSHRETASSFLSSSFLSRTLNEEDIHSREEREKKELTDLLRERDVDIETPSSSLREKQAEEEKKKKAFCCEEAPCTPERSEKSEKEVKKKIERAEEEKEEKKKKILERRKKHNDREQREGEIAEGRGRRSCPLYQVESLFYLCEALYACKQWKRLGFLLFSRHLSLLSQHPALLLLASKLLSLKQEHRECILLLQQHRHTWLAQSTSSVPSLLVDALELSLAVALQRAGKFQEALIVLCESYRRQPMQPKLLFALFGSGALRPEEELNLLKATSFSLENLWVKHLTVALISATRGEEPSDIWMKVCSETDLLQSSQQPSSSFSSSCFSSSSPPPPRPPGLQGMPLVVGLGGRCLTVQDVLEYIEDMYPSSHIPPEALYSSVNVTIQAFRAYRKHNLPLALAISDLLLQSNVAEALYVLPVYVSCCLQLEKVAELHLLCEKLGETLSGEGFNYYNEDRQEIGDEKVEERDEEGEEGERGERRSRRKGEERDSYSTANGRRDGRSLSPSDKAILAVASAYAEGSLLIAEGTYAKAIEFLTKTVSPSEQEVYLNPSWLPAQIALAHAVSAQLEEQEKQQEEEEEKETEETDQKRERNPYSCGASLSSSGAPSSSFFTPGIPPPSSRSQVRGIYRLLISIFKGDAKSHLYLANEILLMEEKAHFLSSRESCLAEEEEEEEKEEKEESLCATRMQRRSQRRRRIEEVCHYLRAALELDKRDVTILYQYARVLLHYYRHRSKEALDLIDRALVECTYTREAGPIRGRGDIIDLERDEEKNKKSQQNHVSLKERKEEEEREGDIENLDDEDHRENCHERGNPREEELLLHLCSFSADLLHALRGQALLELWRQQSDTVKSPGGEEEKEEEGLGGSNWTSFSQRNLGEEEEQPQQEDAFSPREERNRPKNERALLSSSSCASHEDRGDRERSSFLLLRASIEAFQKSLQLNPANLESQQLLSTALRLYGECPNGRGEREIT